MPFVKIEKARIGLGSLNIEPIITMGAYLADGKKHKLRSIAFRITYPLIVQLGWTIKDHKLSIGINEGTGTDKGFLQLVEDELGYRGAQGHRSNKSDSFMGISVSITIERFQHYVLNECPVSAKPANHIVDGNALIVECPDWLRFNPLSVPEEVKEESRRPLQRRNAIDQEEDAKLHLNRQDRRKIAHEITRGLRHK
jgi:hypothetical protein